MVAPSPSSPKPGALLEAVFLADIDAVRRRLREGADPNERDAAFGNTPLIRAASYGFLDIVSLLLDNGAGIDSRNKYGDTALTFVAGLYIANRDAMIRLLLDRGADAALRNNTGQTAVEIAIERSHPPQSIKMLKEAVATRQRLTEDFARAAAEKIRTDEAQKRAAFSARQDRLKEIARKRPRPGWK